MKRKLGVALAAAAVIVCAIPAFAHRYDRQNDGHPLQIVGWVVHPVGVALEYAIVRPMHRLVSSDDADIWFGHQAKPSDDGTYYEWLHGDYSPSIKKLRDERS